MNLIDKACNAIEGEIVKLHDKKATDMVHGMVPVDRYQAEGAYLRALRDVRELVLKVKAKLHEN